MFLLQPVIKWRSVARIRPARPRGSWMVAPLSAYATQTCATATSPGALTRVKSFNTPPHIIKVSCHLCGSCSDCAPDEFATRIYETVLPTHRVISQNVITDFQTLPTPFLVVVSDDTAKTALTLIGILLFVCFLIVALLWRHFITVKSKIIFNFRTVMTLVNIKYILDHKRIILLPLFTHFVNIQLDPSIHFTELTLEFIFATLLPPFFLCASSNTFLLTLSLLHLPF